MLGCSSAEVLGPVQAVVAVLSGARVLYMGSDSKDSDWSSHGFVAAAIAIFIQSSPGHPATARMVDCSCTLWSAAVYPVATLCG